MSQVRSLVVCVALLTMGAASGQDALVRARQLYNQRDYDSAIAAAKDARRRAEAADAAGVVLARAHLERYRRGVDAADLAIARATLAEINTARLSPRDRGEWTGGIGELLFFDGRYGAAAETFDAASGYAAALDVEARERITGWWATAVERQTRGAADERRRELYGRILSRMEAVLRSTPESAAASYWLAVAAAGTDDLDRAWDAAVSGWMRAPAAGSRAATLRADLDAFVLQWLVPERAKRGSAAEAARRAAALRAEWDAIKQAWPLR